MSYTSTLQSNNTSLQSILNTVNSLPEASTNEASIETCTIKVDPNYI